ncbi:hydrogenase maturation protease [Fibrobacterota bacterium]
MDSRCRSQSVVIGLGNPLLCDDAIGLLVVKEMASRSRYSCSGVSYRVNYSGGVDLLYDLAGFDRAIIVDAVDTGKHKPGACCEYRTGELGESRQPRLEGSHGVSLSAVLELGRKLEYEMPGEIVIFGVEGREFTRFSESPSEPVLNTRDEVISRIEKKLRLWNKNNTGTDDPDCGKISDTRIADNR